MMYFAPLSYEEYRLFLEDEGCESPLWAIAYELYLIRRAMNG